MSSAAIIAALAAITGLTTATRHDRRLIGSERCLDMVYWPSVSCVALRTGAHAITPRVDRAGIVADGERTYGVRRSTPISAEQLILPGTTATLPPMATATSTVVLVTRTLRPRVFHRLHLRPLKRQLLNRLLRKSRFSLNQPPC